MLLLEKPAHLTITILSNYNFLFFKQVYLIVQGNSGDVSGGSWGSGTMAETKTVAFLFLSLPGFMVLKPVEHILPFYLPVLPQLCCDLFYLLRIWSSHSSSVQHL